MSIKTMLKARSAAKKYNEHDVAGSMKLYEECVQEGLKDPRQLLNYALLLIRDDQYPKAREMLVSMQKYPMADDLKRELFVDYATCVYKMGEIDKGIELLERQNQKQPCGLVYQTLGYLYVEAGNAEKALEFNKSALEYDDEDPIVLDNMGQTYYRLLNDKETAKTYFDKAIELKPGQIDTLYFLSRYDLENGDKDAAKEKLEKVLEGRFSPLNHVTRQQIEDELKTL